MQRIIRIINCPTSLNKQRDRKLQRVHRDCSGLCFQSHNTHKHKQNIILKKINFILVGFHRNRIGTGIPFPEGEATGA